MTICDFTDETTEMIDCMCITCQRYIRDYGYNKKGICNIICNLIRICNRTKGIQNKCKISEIIFSKFVSPDGHKLLENNRSLHDIAKHKLIYLYNVDGHFHCYLWYRRIFNERIPIL